MDEEVEIKVKISNPKQVEETLNNTAKFIRERTQKDEYFTPKHKDFFSHNPVIEYFRIRNENENDNIEYHFLHFDQDGKLLKTDEYKTKVENTKMLFTILEKLDMVHKVTVTKNRKYFEYKNFEILIDHIEELGFFLEIEAKKVIGSVKETKDNCYKLLEELKIEWNEPEIGGYPLMILEKIRGNKNE